jgi:heparanase
LALAFLVAAVGYTARQETSPVTVTPATLPRIATVDDRYQSYNVEMAEVIGGKFWKPYNKLGKNAQKNSPVPESARPGGGTFQIGQDPAMFEARPPVDLSNARLRKLATALGPAYMRVSGTWANSAYFQDSDDPAPPVPPKGFQGVLTRREWAGVLDFAHAVDARIVTSFAISEGVRDAAGMWRPDQARRLIDYTKSIGGEISAAEFFNEPSFAAMGGAPAGYDAAAYARDFAIFRPFAKAAAPGMLIVGPGSVGEGGVTLVPGPLLGTAELLAAEPRPVFDVFSYHFYGAASNRCASSMPGVAGTTPEAALSEEWLSRTDRVYDFYAGLRDRFEPGKPIWITETADAACGGNPWAATFLDSFRYLDQHGRLAKRGVSVIFHNTLASSEYGLIDQNTLAPRPNYWAALLWRQLMGRVVLDAGPPRHGLHLYAHSLRDHPGGVALLVINTDQAASQAIELDAAAERYTLASQNLQGATVELNGRELKLGANDALPQWAGVPTRPGHLTFAPASITFLAIPNAGNARCR